MHHIRQFHYFMNTNNLKISPIIFARMSSSRLPGKSLLDLSGKPLLSYVVERARRIKNIGPIILATSDLSSDDALEDFAKLKNIEVFRGDLNNVAKRALDCALAYGLDGFVRICGDRPFFDSSLIDVLLQKFIDDDLDLATNVKEKTFPAGMTVEIISTDSLKYVCSVITDKADKEHLTPYYYNNIEKFKIHNMIWENPEDAKYSFVVDTKSDFDKAVWMASELKNEVHAAPITQLIKLAKRWDEIN